MLPVTSVFKVPFPVKRKSVLSGKELKHMQRKARGFGRLLKHPRKNTPELQKYILKLRTLQQAFIQCAKRPFMMNMRKIVDSYVEMMKPLEDILIRVILRNEDVKIVCRQQWPSQTNMGGTPINKIMSSCQFHQKWRCCTH
ncbi:hypothetical protein CAEBREN_24423 [Caenorhabditis brenneri]|uniref:Uncharacterized protein n=1 Tax=Caenorhabditis brenneri TaxID=135651 RepID=G0MBE7_CAEBE|nr:hypothetical protein CAEBREN_24423 [Caenorhabditis brenneri]